MKCPKCGYCEDKKIDQSQFEEFWRMYPRNQGVSKMKARQAWAKLNQEEQVECINSLISYRAYWVDTETRFIPHPSTFLNERRFETPPIAEKSNRDVYL